MKLLFDASKYIPTPVDLDISEEKEIEKHKKEIGSINLETIYDRSF